MITRFNEESKQDLTTEVSSVVSGMKDKRAMIEPMIRDVTRFLRPQRMSLDYADDADLSASKVIFDGEGITAKNRMASGLFSMAMGPTIDWLRAEIINKDKSPIGQGKQGQRITRLYANECSKFMLETLANSNFYQIMSADTDDSVCFGTTVVMVDEDDEENITNFSSVDFRNFYIEDNKYGRADLMAQVIPMTNRVFLQVYKDEIAAADKMDTKLGERAVESMKKKLGDMKYVLNVRCPRDTVHPGVFNNEKKFASYHFLLSAAKSFGSMTLLRVSGDDFQKWSAWRFSKYQSYPYGGSPGMESIYDVKMLQVQSKSMTDAGQLMSNPPWLADRELSDSLRIVPGRITFRDRNDLDAKPLLNGAAYPYGVDLMERTSEIIRHHFKSDFFMPISAMQASSRERTRQEILSVQAEGAAALSNVIATYGKDRIEPVIKAFMLNEIQQGRFPEPPKEMDVANSDITVRLTGVLFQAQKRYIAQSTIATSLAQALQFANVDPNVRFRFNIDKVSTDVARLGGLDEEYIKDDNEYEKILQANAEREQAMMEAEMRSMAARDLPAKAKAPEPGSVLDEEMKAARGR